MKRCYSTLFIRPEKFNKKFCDNMFIASKVKEGEKYDCVITYPLKRECKFKVLSDENLLEMVLQICNKYRQIYQEERETMSGKEGFISKNSLNRDTSNGKWGIWGHMLGDITIHSITLDDVNKKIEFRINS